MIVGRKGGEAFLDRNLAHNRRDRLEFRAVGDIKPGVPTARPPRRLTNPEAKRRKQAPARTGHGHFTINSRHKKGRQMK